MANRLFFILFIVVLTLGYAVFQSLQLDKKLASDSVLQTNSVLKNLPDANYNLLAKDEFLNLKLLSKDNYLVVHFWASWCAPCEKEFPQLLTLISSLKELKDVKFLLVSVNDKTSDIKKFLKKYNVPTENVYILEDQKYLSQKLFGTYKLPETYVFSKQSGLLVKRFSGPQDWTKQYFKSFFNQLSI